MDTASPYDGHPPKFLRAFYTVLAYQLWMGEQSSLAAPSLDPTDARLGKPFEPPVNAPSLDDLQTLLNSVAESIIKFSEHPRAPRTRAMVDEMASYLEDLLREDDRVHWGGLEPDLRQEFEAQLRLYRPRLDVGSEVREVKGKASTVQQALSCHL